MLGATLLRIDIIPQLTWDRFGHEAIATCEYCTSWSDFALFVFPGALWDYLREILLIGALTLKGTRHSQHRTLGVGALCVAALFEAYLVLTVTINLPKEPENLNKTWQMFERLYGGHGVVMVCISSFVSFQLKLIELSTVA